MGGWWVYPRMGGWTIGLGFMLRGKRTFAEKKSRLERERKRGLSSEGVILSIVLRAFLPVTRSPERSRLYHSVYPLFSGTFTIRYRNTTVVASHFPFATPPPFLLPGIGMFPLVILFVSILYLGFSWFACFLPSLLSLVSHGITLLSEITRKAYLCFIVKRVLYTCLRRDIFVHVREMKKHRLHSKRGKISSLWESLQKFGIANAHRRDEDNRIYS